MIKLPQKVPALSAIVQGVAIASLAMPAPTMAQQPEARVAQGRMAGKQDGDVAIFHGVPFAAPPVGQLRWAPPAEPAGWGDHIRDATQAPNSCPQGLTPDGFMMWTSEYMAPSAPGVAEDCLFANIWAPRLAEGGDPLPVLVYIHGGAYTSGSGTVPIYDGANLAKQGLVVVTINYRLGALGFLAHPELSAEQGGASGNYAIADQIAALRWIRSNIAAFGGDPHKVTIAGQSAGGGSVLALLASPEARGLFRAAIVQSAPGMGSYPALASAEQKGTALLKQWGANGIAEARALPADALLAPAPPGVHAPIADGRVIPAGFSAGGTRLASDVPVMTGYTLNDLFVPARRPTAAEWRAEASQRYGAQADEFLRHYPGETEQQAADSAAREATARAEMAPILAWQQAMGLTSPVYAYLFSHVEPGPKAAEYGAFHSSELPYMFDTLHLSPGRDFTATDRRVVQQFSGAVVNFVTSGNPAGGEVPAWPALNETNKAVMEFDEDAHLSRLYPAGADSMIAAGQAPAMPAFGPPPE